MLFPPPRDKRAAMQGWALQRGTRGQAAWLVEGWAAFACPGLGVCWGRPGAIAITRQASNRKHGAHVLEAECTRGNVVTPSLTDPSPSAPKSSRCPPPFHPCKRLGLAGRDRARGRTQASESELGKMTRES